MKQQLGHQVLSPLLLLTMSEWALLVVEISICRKYYVTICVKNTILPSFCLYWQLEWTVNKNKECGFSMDDIDLFLLWYLKFDDVDIC